MAKSNQGKQLPPEKIAEIGALQSLGQGARTISREIGISRSTAGKYQRLTPALRDSKRFEALDRGFGIIERADEIVLEKIEASDARSAAVIRKLYTDSLLDLMDPSRFGTKVVSIGGDVGLSFTQAKPEGSQE